MKILRNDGTYILKKKIDLKHLDIYDEEKMVLAKECLKELINNTVVDDFKFLKEMFYLSKNNDLKKVYDNYESQKCYNCCTSLSVMLKKKLDKILGKTYLVTCKSIGFSTPCGDELLKEAHTFIIYPSLKDGKILFTLFDAGFRNYNPMQFYINEESNIYPYENGKAQVIYNSNQNYPYLLKLDKTLKRNFKIEDTNILLFFNPYYETLKINEYDKICYKAKHSYKIMDYCNKVCIGLNIINGDLTLYSKEKEENYNLNELLKISDEQIESILKSYFKALHKEQDLSDFIKILRFIPNWVNAKIVYEEVIKDVETNNF